MHFIAFILYMQIMFFLNFSIRLYGNSHSSEALHFFQSVLYIIGNYYTKVKGIIT